MKIHELRPAPGSHRPRTRVGRGIAAGKGKTAGRGTKGQKARAGGSIPPWFEGGQTPLHMRIPKLRGFKPRFSVEYEVVNVGAIASLVELGAFENGEAGSAGTKAPKAGSAAPITVNQDILRGVGLVRTLNKPLKILGGGDLSTPLFVVADAFSKAAVTKIEAAGGSVSVLEIPTESRAALGIDVSTEKESKPKGSKPAADAEAPEEPAAEGEAEDAKPSRRGRARAAHEPAEAEPQAEAEPAEAEPQGEAAEAATDETESTSADESAESADGA
jgi:large subunit ribosomal protein L15